MKIIKSWFKTEIEISKDEIQYLTKGISLSEHSKLLAIIDTFYVKKIR